MKYRRRHRPRGTNKKQRLKSRFQSNIWVIKLNVIGLNAPIKVQRLHTHKMFNIYVLLPGEGIILNIRIHRKIKNKKIEKDMHTNTNQRKLLQLLYFYIK